MTQRWSYQAIEIKRGFTGFKAGRIQEELNRQGLLGWELVSFTMPEALGPAVAVFKKAQ